MATRSLAGHAAHFAYPTLLGLIDDLGTLLLEQYLGVSARAFAAPPTAPHVPAVLAALRLLNRETYAFLLRRDLPLLSALPTRVVFVYYEGPKRCALTHTEPRPWHRQPPLVDYAVATHQRLAIFAQRDFWARLPSARFLSVAVGSIRHGNTFVVTHALALRPDHVRAHRAALLRAAIQHDCVAAFRLLLPLQQRTRTPTQPWADFVNRAPVADVIDSGALACFNVLHAAASARGAEDRHAFLRGCVYRLRRWLGHDETPSALSVTIRSLYAESTRAVETSRKRPRDAHAADARATKRARVHSPPASLFSDNDDDDADVVVWDE